MADDENTEDGSEVEEQTTGGEEPSVEEPNVEEGAEASAGENAESMTFDEVKSDEVSPMDADDGDTHTAKELEPVFDVPVNVQAVLGKSYLEVSQLLKLGPGAVVELDRKVGEAIDIYVNDRLVARGEVVLLDENLGVTMTEIIKGDRI